jgi:hypothetical protein
MMTSGQTHLEIMMKHILTLTAFLTLTACVAPDTPVTPDAFGSDGLADSACRAAAAKEGLSVRSITAFREVTDGNGPSGMSGIMTTSAGEAKCDFSYATGKATVTVY